MFAAHKQQITAHAQGEIADQCIAHQGHEGAAEHRCCGPSARAAEALMGLDEGLDLIRVLQEEANGLSLIHI